MCQSPKIEKTDTALLPPALSPSPLALPDAVRRKGPGLSALRLAGKALGSKQGPTSGLSLPAPATTA